MLHSANIHRSLLVCKHPSLCVCVCVCLFVSEWLSKAQVLLEYQVCLSAYIVINRRLTPPRLCSLIRFSLILFCLSFSFHCCLSASVCGSTSCDVETGKTATALFPLQNQRLHLYTPASQCHTHALCCTVTPHRRRCSVYLSYFKLQGVTNLG